MQNKITRIAAIIVLIGTILFLTRFLAGDPSVYINPAEQVTVNKDNQPVIPSKDQNETALVQALFDQHNQAELLKILVQ